MPELLAEWVNEAPRPVRNGAVVIAAYLDEERILVLAPQGYVVRDARSGDIVSKWPFSLERGCEGMQSPALPGNPPAVCRARGVVMTSPPRPLGGSAADDDRMRLMLCDFDGTVQRRFADSSNAEAFAISECGTWVVGRRFKETPVWNAATGELAVVFAAKPLAVGGEWVATYDANTIRVSRMTNGSERWSKTYEPFNAEPVVAWVDEDHVLVANVGPYKKWVLELLDGNGHVLKSAAQTGFDVGQMFRVGDHVVLIEGFPRKTRKLRVIRRDTLATVADTKVPRLLALAPNGSTGVFAHEKDRYGVFSTGDLFQRPYRG